jgi:hypothetical protein
MENNTAGQRQKHERNRAYEQSRPEQNGVRGRNRRKGALRFYLSKQLNLKLKGATYEASQLNI